MLATKCEKPKICLHCRKYKVSRPRGLCWQCDYTDGVMELYPPTSKCGRRGVGNGHKRGRKPPTPTTEMPGSEGKILVMIERAEQGYELFHEDDERRLPDVSSYERYRVRAATDEPEPSAKRVGKTAQPRRVAGGLC